mmetsp:Transcript_14936/g.14522  ORF Transcript_14936/g.14522 Transcript_14936/m.14522 type:complete len:227 (-) Transcript_14936:337-1017(-)
MASLLYLVQQSPQVVVPIIQHIICELALLKHHYPLHPIYLGMETIVDHHISNLGLSSVYSHSDQVGQSGQLHSAVILLNDSDIMLDQLLNEFSQMEFIVFSLWLEGRVGSELLLYFFHVEGHDLISLEFLQEFPYQLILLQFSRIILLYNVGQVYSFIVVGAQEQVKDKVLERFGLFLASGVQVEVSCRLIVSIINNLVAFGHIQMHLLMNIVLYHEQEELDLLSL